MHRALRYLNHLGLAMRILVPQCVLLVAMQCMLGPSHVLFLRTGADLCALYLCYITFILLVPPRLTSPISGVLCHLRPCLREVFFSAWVPWAVVFFSLVHRTAAGHAPASLLQVKTSTSGSSSVRHYFSVVARLGRHAIRFFRF